MYWEQPCRNIVDGCCDLLYVYMYICTRAECMSNQNLTFTHTLLAEWKSGFMCQGEALGNKLGFVMCGQPHSTSNPLKVQHLSQLQEIVPRRWLCHLLLDEAGQKTECEHIRKVSIIHGVVFTRSCTVFYCSFIQQHIYIYIYAAQTCDLNWDCLPTILQTAKE